jgi:excisionase family DNA binding protein
MIDNTCQGAKTSAEDFTRLSYSVSEASQITGMKPATIRLHIRNKKLAANRVGKSYLIPDSVIMKMVTAGVIENGSNKRRN